MPTYEYECQQCHERVEAVQKFTDPSLTVCPLCGGELRKVFSAVGIVFKGSGFYKNDSRGSAPKTTTTPSTSTPSESSAAASSSTPAPTPAPASTPSTSTPSTASSD
jgi:putative FmdB family regulatory protein